MVVNEEFTEVSFVSSLWMRDKLLSYGIAQQSEQEELMTGAAHKKSCTSSCPDTFLTQGQRSQFPNEEFHNSLIL